MLFSLNSIYFQISIYTWQHTSIHIHGNGLENKLLKTYINSSYAIYNLTIETFKYTVVVCMFTFSIHSKRNTSNM